MSALRFISTETFTQSARAVFVAALLTVTVFSIFSFDPTPNPGQSDKLKHFFAYAVLGLLAVASAPQTLSRFGAPWAVAVFALGAWGVCLELVQSTLPAREASVYDAAANLIGAAGGAAGCIAAFSRLRRRMTA